MSDFVEGFPFLPNKEHDTPRNAVCRQFMVAADRLHQFASVPWCDVVHGAKDVLRAAAAKALAEAPQKERAPKALLLYGAAGCGKTARVRALARELVEGRLASDGVLRATVFSAPCSALAKQPGLVC